MGLILEAMTTEDRGAVLEAQRAVAARRKPTKTGANREPSVPKGKQFAESLREGTPGSSVPTGDAFTKAIRG
jgi:hypothetical protein